jgi:hypothetical protein
MTQPPVVPQPQATPGDKVTLWGVLGIVFSICCWPLGLVFDILGLMEAKKVGKSPTLAYIGFGLVGLAIILTILQYTVGIYNTK